MYWDVIIVLKCKKTEFNIVQDRLICHHSIYEINPDKERKKETKTEKEHIGAPEINANRINSNNNEYQFITCKASVFHQNDERGLKLYLGTVKNLEIVHFIPLSNKEKLKQILKVSRYSAIIVFIVIFSHESIPLVLKKEFGIEDLLVAIGFSLLGAIPTLVIDTFIVWKEHHN